jgi:hypothetical protein
MKPNIFDISTKELSQDAFLTWLLKWADSDNATIDYELHQCGIEFLTQLIKKQYPDFDEKITTVSAGRQWEKIDVWAKVNSRFLIIIEDKTYTEQHSGQLSRYRLIGEKWCIEQSPNYNPPICIYLKTGNESEQSLNLVLKEGFKIYNRLEFISLLNQSKTTNEIFNDFKERLGRIEQANNEWDLKLIKDWNENDWQGFFQYLENQINIVGWKHVNNPNGGFWNAIINWSYWGIYPAYLQTEQYKLCFKLSTDPKELNLPENTSRKNVRDSLSHLILNSAKEKNITTIKRPARFGNGKYMTVAIVEPKDWLGNKDEKVNKEKVLENLNFYKNFLLEIIQ